MKPWLGWSENGQKFWNKPVIHIGPESIISGTISCRPIVYIKNIDLIHWKNVEWSSIEQENHSDEENINGNHIFKNLPCKHYHQLV